MSPAWLVAAVVALGHAAGDEVRAGGLSLPEAESSLRTATLALLGAHRMPPAPDARGSREPGPRQAGRTVA
ncbi:hypothetical protein AB0K02_01315 [Streptomyces sp. NPDC049597]|uniref:hypothetical protein n=1 Tax=Streptomyces sp. NPDC049597 TaxID=3155276 RepID=UPI003435A9EF